ncbi:hypothetical protein RCL1_002503 [Eukaryota sp. TZLM3-RCL]
MPITRTSTRSTSFTRFFSHVGNKKKPIRTSSFTMSPVADRKRLKLRFTESGVVPGSLESKSSLLSENFPSLDNISSDSLTAANSSTHSSSQSPSCNFVVPFNLDCINFPKNKEQWELFDFVVAAIFFN